MVYRDNKKQEVYTMAKTIRIDGITYKIRYTYKRDDDTLWHVLSDASGLQGKYGDEWPATGNKSL